MKLTKEQQQEIADLQAQKNQTKRVTSPELEKILLRSTPSFRPWFCKSSRLHGR